MGQPELTERNQNETVTALTDASAPTNGAGAVDGAIAGGIIAREEQRAVAALRRAIEDVGLSLGNRPLDLRAIPFEGTWGAASSICRALASEVVMVDLESTGELEGLSKKELKRRVNEHVPAKAQELAEAIAERIRTDAEARFVNVDAANGYVNISFDASAMATSLIHEVLVAGPTYGQGAPKADLVMVEHSQPNTHKAFHVGHLRNSSLGVAISRILRKAGYQVLDATYIGDIGRHVIQCLWCYERFHLGQEPATAIDRGRWLGELYAESERRLRYREDVIAFLLLLANDDVAFVGAIDRLLKALHHRTQNGEDVAYLLGRFIHQQPIDEAQLRQEAVVVTFWPLVGEQLREQVENPKPLPPLAEGEPEPTTTPEERLATWEALAPSIDWWMEVPAWREEMKATWRRWEAQEESFVNLWRDTREWSMADFRRIFAELGAEFDAWFFESEVEEPGKLIVRELLDAGIAEISDGLPVVKIDEKLGLETETYRTLPILRSDGTSLYSTKDLALTKHKFDVFKVDRALWVVDVRQSLYFDQVFKILEIWGMDQAKHAQHLGYEFVALPEGVISSRKGNVPVYDDIRDAVLARAEEIIAEKNPDLGNEKAATVAHQVAIGSLKYAMLARDINKVVTFKLDEALSFDGHAAPYIQYAHARASRILERGKTDRERILAGLDEVRFEKLEPSELNLLQQIAALPEVIQRAAEENRPTVICQYVYELAKSFNDFYHACPVLQSEEPARSARLALVAATRRALANGLDVLAIAAPEAM